MRPSETAVSLKEFLPLRCLWSSRLSAAMHTKHTRKTGKTGRKMCCGDASPVAEVRAVVVMVTVTLALVEPSSVIEDGETLQLAAFGAPVQVHDTVLLKPPLGDMEIVKFAVSPAVTVLLVGLAETAKSEDAF